MSNTLPNCGLLGFKLALTSSSVLQRVVEPSMRFDKLSLNCDGTFPAPTFGPLAKYSAALDFANSLAKSSSI